MVLVDTSVWVDHLRNGRVGLADLLSEGVVACHPFVIGELACGGLKNRVEILSLLQALPASIVAKHEEVMSFIENHKLMNRGMGYIDVSLLASALLAGIPIWSLDKKLAETAERFGLAFENEERR